MGTLLAVAAFEVGAVPIVQAALSPIESAQLKPRLTPSRLVASRQGTRRHPERSP
ncbi:MAG TPA: hypothetical protein VGI36_18955 [Candidatus Binataceae bacterium]